MVNGKKGIEILIIDDSTDTIKTYKHFLRKDTKYEYVINETDTGEKALSYLENHHVDLILLDYQLPDLLGIEILEKISKDEKWKFLPIIMMTNYDDEELVVKSIKSGATNFIVKSAIVLNKFLEIVHLAMEECEEKRAKNKAKFKRFQRSKLDSMGILTTGVAHELNNPLTIIVGSAHVIEKKYSHDEFINMWTQKIINSAERMNKIIEQIRQFSRDSTEISNVEKLNLSQIMQTLFYKFNSNLEKCNIKMHLDLDPKIPLIWGNIEQIEVVISNLIHNSIDAFIKYMRLGIHQPCEIKVKVFHSNYGVNILFEDNAKGIDPEIEDRVFDPFFTTKDPGEGIGLGLSVAYGIIEKHKGSISLINRYGKGVVFDIFIPAIIDDKSSREEFLHNLGIPLNHINTKDNRPSLLIIDDEESICEVLSDLLSEDFIVKTYTNPEKAVEEISKVKFDLILTDLKMPKVSGFDILNTSQKFQATTPVVIMSGHARNEVESKEIIRNGAKDVLSKPFERVDKMSEILKKYIAA